MTLVLIRAGIGSRVPHGRDGLPGSLPKLVLYQGARNCSESGPAQMAPVSHVAGDGCGCSPRAEP